MTLQHKQDAATLGQQSAVWAAFTQQVCNRLKRSLLKELGPEPRLLLEAIIGREWGCVCVCRLDTHRAGRAEKGGVGEVGGRGGEGVRVSQPLISICK